ncbi:hypothetical protein QO021_28400 (plasmid) [Pseudomonas amygdali pv. lachrymans]|uniref:hypothetical protein n=1 Tax=Pseudomonas amygdali TaxID=47877 RepID=UPI0006B88B08|nr:hypothetical protein [Pseudomonas amygdali]KPC02317.1 Uncharacterized protein AC501_3603 [Pseudomonas amygdali pv. lachrymans]RMM39062.1 hypothetical protein ALQ79_200638 [Pseudomonas amygdali pv. lachrymans]WIO61480.1 hypothetical protein QO021_28400 [Pseudomonas amygdali pv. lachrymans]
MTTFTNEYTAVKTRIAVALTALGWKVAPARDMEISCLIARMDYETVVGEKTATIALEPWSESLMLVSNYDSEGRNILSANMKRFDPAMTDENLTEAVTLYVAALEKDVNGSYARRIHLNHPQTA